MIDPICLTHSKHARQKGDAQSQVFTILKGNFEDKGENAGNQHFFYNVFFPPKHYVQLLYHISFVVYQCIQLENVLHFVVQ